MGSCAALVDVPVPVSGHAPEPVASLALVRIPVRVADRYAMYLDGRVQVPAHM